MKKTLKRLIILFINSNFIFFIPSFSQYKNFQSLQSYTVKKEVYESAINLIKKQLNSEDLFDDKEVSAYKVAFETLFSFLTQSKDDSDEYYGYLCNLMSLFSMATQRIKKIMFYSIKEIFKKNKGLLGEKLEETFFDCESFLSDLNIFFNNSLFENLPRSGKSKIIKKMITFSNCFDLRKVFKHQDVKYFRWELKQYFLAYEREKREDCFSLDKNGEPVLNFYSYLNNLQFPVLYFEDGIDCSDWYFIYLIILMFDKQEILFLQMIDEFTECFYVRYIKDKNLDWNLIFEQIQTKSEGKKRDRADSGQMRSDSDCSSGICSKKEEIYATCMALINQIQYASLEKILKNSLEKFYEDDNNFNSFSRSRSISTGSLDSNNSASWEGRVAFNPFR